MTDPTYIEQMAAEMAAGARAKSELPVLHETLIALIQERDRYKTQLANLSRYVELKPDAEDIGPEASLSRIFDAQFGLWLEAGLTEEADRGPSWVMWQYGAAAQRAIDGEN